MPHARAFLVFALLATSAMAQGVVPRPPEAPEAPVAPVTGNLPIDPAQLPPEEPSPEEPAPDIILPQITPGATNSFPEQNEATGIVRSRPRKASPPLDPARRTELAKLARVMGSLHALRVLCKGEDDQLWRERMATMLDLETRGLPLEREGLVSVFNTSYNGEQAKRVTCPSNAATFEAIYSKQGRALALSLARWGDKATPATLPAANTSSR